MKYYVWDGYINVSQSQHDLLERVIRKANANTALVAACQAIVDESDQMLAIRQGTDDPVSDARLFELIEQLRPLLTPKEAVR